MRVGRIVCGNTAGGRWSAGTAPFVLGTYVCLHIRLVTRGGQGTQLCPAYTRPEPLCPQAVACATIRGIHASIPHSTPSLLVGKQMPSAWVLGFAFIKFPRGRTNCKETTDAAASIPSNVFLILARSDLVCAVKGTRCVGRQWPRSRGSCSCNLGSHASPPRWLRNGPAPKSRLCHVSACASPSRDSRRSTTLPVLHFLAGLASTVFLSLPSRLKTLDGQALGQNPSQRSALYPHGRLSLLRDATAS